MLERLLRHINNWFLVKDGAHIDAFTISGGSIAPADWLQNGQYYRIIDSVFNDGLHQHPASDLIDETFTGAVWALAIPSDVLDIAKDAEAWEVKYGAQAQSPYTSETMTGVYSYTKTATGGDEAATTVEAVFKSRLDPFRKMPGVSGYTQQKRARTPQAPAYRDYLAWR